MATSSNVQVYTIGTNGGLTAQGAALSAGPSGSEVFAVAADPTGRFVYVSCLNTNYVQAYSMGLMILGVLPSVAASGGSSNPTLGANSIGIGAGIGPATAAQNSWQAITLSDGSKAWIPVWK